MRPPAPTRCSRPIAARTSASLGSSPLAPVRLSRRRDRTPRSAEVTSFEELVDEAAEVSVEGWDFSWLDGRATEERPSWGYQQLLRRKLAAASAALDIQ